jgi:hypothetical protein
VNSKVFPTCFAAGGFFISPAYESELSTLLKNKNPDVYRRDSFRDPGGEISNFLMKDLEQVAT